jgi:hypothetical protein
MTETLSMATHTFHKIPPARVIGDEKFGIVNRYNQLWTDTTFATPEEAFAYLDNFWKKREEWLNSFLVVPVEVTVSIKIEPIQTYRINVFSPSCFKAGR